MNDSSSDDPLTADQDQRSIRDKDKDEDEDEEDDKESEDEESKDESEEGEDESDEDEYGDKESEGETFSSGKQASGPFALNREWQKSFWDNYRRMKKESKWTLSTGKIVEDVLFNRFKNQDNRTLSRSLHASWILDFDVPDIQCLFTNSEKEEIYRAVPSPPSVRELEDIVDTFDVLDEQTLDRFISDHSLGRGAFASRQLDDHLRDWLHMALMKWRTLCGTSQLNGTQPEQWWACNLWVYVIDNALQTLGAMTLKRGETTSKAGSKRKNKGRTLATPTRMRLGGRVDGVLKCQDTKTEYLVTETATALDQSGQGAKFYHDHFKLARVLHDMLADVHNKFGSNSISEVDIQIIGTLEQGQEWRVYGLQQKGYVSVLRQHFKIDIPSRRDRISKFLRALKYALRIRQSVMAMRQTIENLDENDSHGKEVTIFACQNSPNSQAKKSKENKDKDKDKKKEKDTTESDDSGARER